MLLYSCSSQITPEKSSGPEKLNDVLIAFDNNLDFINKMKEQTALIDQLINSSIITSQQTQAVFKGLPDMIIPTNNIPVTDHQNPVKQTPKKFPIQKPGKHSYNPARSKNSTPANQNSSRTPLPELLTYDCDVATNMRNITNGLNASQDSVNDIKSKLDSLSKVLFQLRLECEELKHQFDINSASINYEPILLPYSTAKDKKPPHPEGYYVIQYENKLSEIEKVIKKYQLKLEKVAVSNKKYVNRLKIQAHGFSSFGTYKITESYDPAEYVVRESSIKGDISSAVDSAITLFNNIKSDGSYKDLKLKFSITVFGYCDTEMPDESQINSLPARTIKLLPTDPLERKIIANEKISEERAVFISKIILGMLNERTANSTEVGICAKGLGIRMPDFSANYEGNNMPDPNRRIAKFFITVIAW